MELTLLMPCLNEANTIEKCVLEAQSFLAGHRVDGEVLVSDNGSTDGSQQLASAAGARVVQASRRGYGAALMTGIEEARGRFVVMGDADHSYDFSGVEPFIKELRNGADLVMGNRFKGGIAAGAMPPLHRYLGNPVLSAIGRLFFRLPVGDFHCGMRGFDTQKMRSLHLQSPGMEFATEMVAKAAFARLKVVEVPTTLRPDGRGRPPHLRTWRDGWRHLRFMLLFSPLWLFLLPGALLFVLGLLAMAMILSGPWQVGGFSLDVHTMLFASAASIIGYQLLQSGVLVQWLGVRSGMRPPGWVPTVLQRKWPVVETCLVGGQLLFAAGLMWSVVIAGDWARSDFGAIRDFGVMRQAIAACTLICLGAQTICGGFFSGALAAGLEGGFLSLRSQAKAK